LSREVPVNNVELQARREPIRQNKEKSHSREKEKASLALSIIQTEQRLGETIAVAAAVQG